MILIIAIYTLLQILLLYVSEHQESKRYYVPVKVTCSISFVMIGIVFAVTSGNQPYFYRLLPSLLLCLAGDLFMGLYNQFHRKRYMLTGLLLFLGAHAGYIFLLYQRNPVISAWTISLPVLGVAAILLLSVQLKLHFGRLRPAVFIYCIFVTELLAKSTYDMYVLQSKSTLAFGIGGILFFLSDFLIIFLYFYHFRQGKHKAWIHYLNLLTYYYALLCFAFSIYYQ